MIHNINLKQFYNKLSEFDNNFVKLILRPFLPLIPCDSFSNNEQEHINIYHSPTYKKLEMYVDKLIAE
jgi:hypothetical protein